MEFNKIQAQLIATLLKIPELQRFNSRTELMSGLPPVYPDRDEASAQADLRGIISGLQKMGRLTSTGGIRPVIVVVENALTYVPQGSEIADELQAIRQELESYYGGEVQPAIDPAVVAVPEALVFGEQRDTRLPFAFVAGAHQTARSIACLTVPRIFDGVPDGKPVFGTGWIIAPGVLITNHHVIDARDKRLGESSAKPADFAAQAAGVVAWFDYHVETTNATYLECKNARLLAADPELDYAVIELVEADKIADRPRLPIVPVQPTLRVGSRMNILQHPGGGPLRLAIRNNFFVSPGNVSTRLWYQTDTEYGASGSPVCNDDWQVVALHHAHVPVKPRQVPQEVLEGKPQEVGVLNEAIKIRDILNSLPAELMARIDAAQKVRPA